MDIRKKNHDNEIIAPLKNKWMICKPEEEVRQKYICPNPECQQSLGLKPYDELLRAHKCPFCKSKFQE